MATLRRLHPLFGNMFTDNYNSEEWAEFHAKDRFGHIIEGIFDVVIASACGIVAELCIPGIGLPTGVIVEGIQLIDTVLQDRAYRIENTQ